MRIKEVTEDISRRGFLQGAGAAMATAATGAQAKAKSQHHVDPHSNKVQPLVQTKKIDANTARKILSRDRKSTRLNSSH